MTSLYEQFGAKYANLRRLEPLIQEIDLEGSLGRVAIPSFCGVPVDLYDSWRRGQTDRDMLKEAFTSAKNLASSEGGVIVRSSALLSEDHPDHMAAGVFQSVQLSPEFNANDFWRAVKTVFLSTQSKAAQTYMESVDINPEDEHMGLVIQTVPERLVTHFTVDTVKYGIPYLTDVRAEKINGLVKYKKNPATGKDMKNYIIKHPYGYEQYRRDDILEHLASPLEVGLFPFMPVDTRMHTDILASDIAVISLLIEKEFGKPVQVEAIGSDVLLDHRFSVDNFDKVRIIQEDTVRIINIVQARQLPDNYKLEQKFCGFPDKVKPIYIGRGFGIINGDYAVNISTNMDGEVHNIYEEDIDHLPEGIKLLALFKSSYATSDTSDNIRNTILSMSQDKRSKIIIVVKDIATYGSAGAHIEAMCAELGIRCVFYDSNKTKSTMTDRELKFGMVKVYSDGIEGRIYDAS
jgi:Pyruvate phosphate dikinase, AMP/ATP-binding domain